MTAAYATAKAFRQALATEIGVPHGIVAGHYQFLTANGVISSL